MAARVDCGGRHDARREDRVSRRHRLDRLAGGETLLDRVHRDVSVADQRPAARQLVDEAVAGLGVSMGALKTVADEAAEVEFQTGLEFETPGIRPLRQRA